MNQKRRISFRDVAKEFEASPSDSDGKNLTRLGEECKASGLKNLAKLCSGSR